ncbi:10 TM acyl transferase domain found in Cas1p-domain-containing protein [Melanogaster broomeanus]|nr:10 TM acyl transferase domain found in Cas1p-domain-containing protein [Melanogaster broomeanus]
MTAKRLFSLDPSWHHHVALSIIACALIAGLLRLILFDPLDPIHCDALLSKGSWLDSAHTNWQPEGCMLHSYQAKDASQCLASRRVVFVGDSVTRSLYFQFIHIIDPILSKEPPDDGVKDSDHSFISASRIKLDFVWDPFLNTTSALALTRPPTQHSSDAHHHEPPALLVLGSGLWYLRYANTSGGLPAWEANIEAHIGAISGARSRPADIVVFLPVEELVFSKLSLEQLHTMHSSDIDAMNSDLYHRIKPSSTTSFPQLTGSTSSEPVSLPLVFNRMLDESQTQDGLHFADPVVQAQANILLNLRCNDEWPKTFPMDKTCCRRYPWPSPVHLIMLAGLVLYTCMLLYRSYLKNPTNGWAIDKDYLAAIIFGAAIFLIYLADRTGLWLKEQKQFSPWTFSCLLLTSLAVGLATIHRADKDLGFLNRDQCDEWKGWMQIAILIYYYLGGSQISDIYNPVWVLVAAYLFMTGYEHTMFYIKKADFGFIRVAQVLVRINLLTLTLAYTMNADYLSYYFAPLVSMWFLIIYLTLGVGSQLNDNTPFLVFKIFLSMGIFAVFISQTRLLETLFEILERIFFIHWSTRQWTFTVTFDHYIAYVGMFAALATIKIREHRLADHPMWPTLIKASTGVSMLVLLWFVSFGLMEESKFAYDSWHPYISFLPIAAFVTLRNATPFLRSCSSRVFAFVGKCSLQTFVIQYHLWLAGDTKGVLLIVPGTRWRPLNFALTTIVFIYVSHQVAWATEEITTWLCDGEKNTLPTTRDATSTGGSTANLSPETVPWPAGGETDEDGPRAEPDTPLRHQSQRWVDRLAEGTARRQSPGFKIWQERQSWRLGVEGGLGVCLALMWLANAMWTNP